MTVGWVDCLARGAQLGPRHPDEGPLGGAGRGPRRAAADETPFPHPVPVPRHRAVPAEHEGLQSGLLLETLPAGPPRHRSSRRLLLSAGRAGRLEPDLRPPRIHPVPVRAAARRRQRPGAAVPGTVRLRRRDGVSVRHQGLRRGGQGHALVSAAGHVDRHGFSHPSAQDAGAGRPAQRVGDCRRGANLLDERHLHPAGAFPRHGAAAGGVQRRAPQVGPARPASAAPNRSDSWETRHEGRAVGSDKGDGAGVGAAVGRPRRPAVSAGARGRQTWSARPGTWKSSGAPGRSRPPLAICCSRRRFAAALDQAQAGLGRLRHGRGHRRAVRHARGIGERSAVGGPAA